MQMLTYDLLSWVLNLVNVFDSSISFGSAFQRSIDRGTKLELDDFFVAGTGYADFQNEYPIVAEAHGGRNGWKNFQLHISRQYRD